MTLHEIRVFNPHARSNRQQPLPATYPKHEAEKRRSYEEQIRDIEHAPFVPMECFWRIRESGFCALQQSCLYALGQEKRTTLHSTGLDQGQGSLSFLSDQQMLASVDTMQLTRGPTELWLTFPLCWPQLNATSPNPLFHFSSSFRCVACTIDFGFSIIICHGDNGDQLFPSRNAMRFPYTRNEV
eukprot:scpid100393/ scgid11375/ 